MSAHGGQWVWRGRGLKVVGMGEGFVQKKEEKKREEKKERKARKFLGMSPNSFEQCSSSILHTNSKGG